MTPLKLYIHRFATTVPGAKRMAHDRASNQRTDQAARTASEHLHSDIATKTARSLCSTPVSLLCLSSY
jgi:hypothetical protein